MNSFLWFSRTNVRSIPNNLLHAQMAKYFTAYRIDHILGFFRIWELPEHAMTGLVGKFRPSIPLSKVWLSSLFEKFHFSLCLSWFSLWKTLFSFCRKNWNEREYGTLTVWAIHTFNRIILRFSTSFYHNFKVPRGFIGHYSYSFFSLLQEKFGDSWPLIASSFFNECGNNRYEVMNISRIHEIPCYSFCPLVSGDLFRIIRNFSTSIHFLNVCLNLIVQGGLQHGEENSC